MHVRWKGINVHRVLLQSSDSTVVILMLVGCQCWSGHAIIKKTLNKWSFAYLHIFICCRALLQYTLMKYIAAGNSQYWRRLSIDKRLNTDLLWVKLSFPAKFREFAHLRRQVCMHARAKLA